MLKRLFGQEFSKDLLINFLNDLFEGEFQIKDVTFSIFSDKLRFIYLSLPFFDKSEEECETGFEKWIYVLKYMEVLERLPFTAQKKIFNHLAKLADVRCLSSEEQEKYDESLKAADDYYGVLMSYYMNGIDEGVAKGEARGSHHKSLEIAKKMMAKGMDENTIMEITGLTQEEIRKLESVN
jgi:predicted transposase/invertase (TIGR01784 family)